jgi:prolyl oligopeptidase PreP (S9A serine peptidase family)
VLPEAKSDVAWVDADTLYVGTDFGPGSMTDSGYPRILKRWKRGTPLAEAKTVFEGRRENIWVGVSVDTTPGFERTLIVRALDFFRQEHYLLQGDVLVRLEVPDDARVSFMHSAGVAGDTLRRTARACPTSWSCAPKKDLRARRQEPDAALRLRRLRGLDDARLLATGGRAWLERGGVYVVANIRGGGEFGPRWHQAAIKANRQRAYDDFIAVAEDLIARKITSPAPPRHPGRQQRRPADGRDADAAPELFGAVVCQVPLLDMQRYHKLLAGASWMGEYGNPDTRGLGLAAAYSPYHNVKPGTEVPEGAVHHLDARRPRAPRPRAQDGGALQEQGTTCCTTRTSRAATAPPRT